VEKSPLECSKRRRERVELAIGGGTVSPFGEAGLRNRALTCATGEAIRG
jgi:hypothetical protein